MEKAPLSLLEALRYARDLANQLRELHQEGRVHGDVAARLVALRASGATLLPPAGGSKSGSTVDDIAAFGGLLYEMLTTRKPTIDALLSTPLEQPHKGPAEVQAAAVRLAERCLGPAPGDLPGMQKVLTELRLLSVQARQWQTAEGTPPHPHAGVEAPEAPETPAELVEPEQTDFPPAGPAGRKSAPPTDGEDEEDLMADGKCPRCRCSKVRVSRPRNRLERLLRSIGFPVRRCHRCYFRYIDVWKACLEMPTKKFNR